MFLWFSQPQTTDYKELYGVSTDLNSHLGLFKQWGGGTHTVCAGGGTKRGWMFSVEHLPTPLVRDIFHLVIKSWLMRGWEAVDFMFFLTAEQKEHEGCLGEGVAVTRGS